LRVAQAARVHQQLSKGPLFSSLESLHNPTELFLKIPREVRSSSDWLRGLIRTPRFPASAAKSGCLYFDPSCCRWVTRDAVSEREPWIWGALERPGGFVSESTRRVAPGWHGPRPRHARFPSMAFPVRFHQPGHPWYPRRLRSPLQPTEDVAGHPQARPQK